MAVGALSSSAPVVVASIGACGSGGSTLLNELFHTSLPVAPRRGVQTTLGVAEAEASSSQAVVLDVEGFDSRCVGWASESASRLVHHTRVVMFSQTRVGLRWAWRPGLA